MIRGVVFDLDDTLYLERDYVRSGFLYIADLLSKYIDVSQGEIFSYLWDLFLQGEKGNLFDQCLQHYPSLQEKVTVNELVTAYREHVPAIEIFPPLKKWLEKNREKFYLGIISDGPLKSQQAKVERLGVKNIIPDIILTDQWGREFWKPNPYSFEILSAQWGLQGEQLIYIGDNPEKDFLAPKRMGWRTVRLKIQGQLNCHKRPLTAEAAPDYEVFSIEHLLEFLNNI